VVFAPDTEAALVEAAALVNTLGADGAEALGDVGALDAFVTRWGWTGSRTHDDGELTAVRALRERLAGLWHLEQDDAVEVINALLRERTVVPQLVDHDGLGWHLHPTGADAPLADRMAAEAAMAFAEVVRAGEWGRLRTCAAAGCGDVLVDVSKNRSRRFCDASCANRTNVAAYRARRAGA
jgi:predicted RNA-binding Zn ribbon-like protein